MHATRRAILSKNLNYILREIYDILSEDALNYPVLVTAISFEQIVLKVINLLWAFKYFSDSTRIITTC